MFTNLFILTLLIGRILAISLSTNVIYKHTQLIKRNISPNLVAFRWRAFRVSLAILLINIFPLIVNTTFLLDPLAQRFMSEPVSYTYSFLFMVMSLYLAYETNETYRHADNTESLTDLIKRKYKEFTSRNG